MRLLFFYGMNKIKTLILVLALQSNTSLFAFIGTDTYLPAFVHTNGNLALHPWEDNILPRFSLYRHGLLDLADYGKLLLHETIPNHGIEIVAENRNSGTVDYRYRLAGYDICDLSASLHRMRGNTLSYRGKYPVAPMIGQNFIRPDIHAAVEMVRDTFTTQDLRVVSTSWCLLATAEGFTPVIDLEVMVAGFLHRVRVDEHQVLAIHRRFFAVQGEFYIHEENRKRNAERERFFIPVQGNGFLENAHFRTAVHGRGRVYRPDNVFGYDDNIREMAEISAFAHVNLMLEWFMKMGYKWQGNNRLVVEIHADRGGIGYQRMRQNPNNALYMPVSEQSSSPRILLGDGDGVNLRNIPLDGDVVSHELGHHIIFERLTSTWGESLIVHEGLSDYFIFAKTNDPCLADSICPIDSNACEVAGQCLRHADNDYVYDDVKNLGSPHIVGQVISAFLWDMREKSGLRRADVDMLAFNGVDYLLPDSGIRGFIESVMLADYELFSGHNCLTILGAAVARGLGAFVSDLDCQGAAKITANRSSAIGLPENVRAGAEAAIQERDDGCGAISLSPNASPYALILVLMPLLIVLRKDPWEN